MEYSAVPGRILGLGNLRGILPFTLPSGVALSGPGMAFGLLFSRPFHSGGPARGRGDMRALISSRPLPPVSLPRRKPRQPGRLPLSWGNASPLYG